MTSSHYDHYTGGNHYQPPSQSPFDVSVEDHRCPSVVIQQSPPGSGSYGAVPGTTVVVQYGYPRRRIHGKGFVTIGAFLLILSVVMFICATLSVTGVIRCEPFLQTGLVMTLFGFGGVILLAGLSIFIPSVRHEMKKSNNQRLQATERDLLIGSSQPRLSPPSQRYYQPSHQSSCQQSSGISPKPFQPIPPSTNPPPCDSTTPGSYSNAGSSTFPDPELGHTNAN